VQGTCGCAQAEKLVNRMDRCGVAYGELGLSLFKMSKSEEVDGLHLAHFTGTVSACLTARAGLYCGFGAVRVRRPQLGQMPLELCELTKLFW